MPTQPPSYQSFPTETLPPEVANFIKAGSTQVNCDPALVALPTLTLLASYIGNTRVLRLNPSWTEPCILWSVTIGKHGTLKSPAYDQPFRRLNRWHYKKKLEWYKAEYKRCKFSKPFGAEPIREWPYPGPDDLAPPLVSEFALEVLTRNFDEQAYHDRPRGLLLTRDDLNDWMQTFERRRKNALAAHKWYEMHRAGTLSVIRKPEKYLSPGHVKNYERAALSVTGTIHPETLTRALNKESALLPRLLMAWPPPKPRQWTNAPEDTSANEAFEAIFDRLLKLDFTRDEAGLIAPKEINLSPEAEQEWANFYNQNAQETESMNGQIRAHFAKLESYCARFALLLHVIKSEALTIQRETMQTAIKLTEWFKNEHRRIYALLSEEKDRALVDQIADCGGATTANELRMSQKRKYPTNAAAEETLNNLVAIGAGVWSVRASTTTGGRPTKEFRLKSAAEAAPKEVSSTPLATAKHTEQSAAPEAFSPKPAASVAEVSEVIVPQVKAVPPPTSPAPQTPAPKPQTLPFEPEIPPFEPQIPFPLSITYMNPAYESHLPPELIPTRRKDTGCKL